MSHSCPTRRSADRPVGEKRLKAGRDFDTLICGIAIGALPHLAPGLMAANPKWPQMVGAIKTVQTQTLQVWMKRRSAEHTSELQSLMRISYADFCLKKKKI